jgi:hypothetical protein
MSTLDEIILDVLNTSNTIQGAALDSICGVWGLCRGVGETDAQLRARVGAYMKVTQPDPITKNLFILLHKLNVKSVREYLPIAWDPYVTVDNYV